jgi:hypothetical protein
MKTQGIYKFLTIMFIIVSFLGCEKENDLANITTNAQIIDFVPEKCYCCWGWVIKIDSDTIKADELPNSELIGYEITTPINVKIETGNKVIDCPSNLYDYYEIKSLILND